MQMWFNSWPSRSIQTDSLEKKRWYSNTRLHHSPWSWEFFSGWDRISSTAVPRKKWKKASHDSSPFRSVRRTLCICHHHQSDQICRILVAAYHPRCEGFCDKVRPMPTNRCTLLLKSLATDPYHTSCSIWKVGHRFYRTNQPGHSLKAELHYFGNKLRYKIGWSTMHSQERCRGRRYFSVWRDNDAVCASAGVGERSRKAFFSWCYHKHHRTLSDQILKIANL